MSFKCFRCESNTTIWKSDCSTGHVQHRLWVYRPTVPSQQVASTEVNLTHLSGWAYLNQKSGHMCVSNQIMCVNKPCEYVVGLGGIVDYTTAMSHF